MQTHGLAEMPPLFLLAIPVLSLCSFQQDGRECFLCLTGHHQNIHCYEQYCESTEAPDCCQSLKQIKKFILLCVNQPDIRKALSAQGSRADRAASRKLTALPPSQDICDQGFIAVLCAKGSGLGNAGCAPFCF